jgi:DNA mismatch repair protein MutL
MHLSVNGRAVAPRGQVAGILDDAYHTLLMKGRFPYVVLAIGVHPAAVDVNVHPTKSEVKFRDPDRVRATIARAIRSIVQAALVVQGWEGGSVVPPADPDAEPDWAGVADAEPSMADLPLLTSAPVPTPAGVSQPVLRGEVKPVAPAAPVADAQQGWHAPQEQKPSPPEPVERRPAPSALPVRLPIREDRPAWPVAKEPIPQQQFMPEPPADDDQVLEDAPDVPVGGNIAAGSDGVGMVAGATARQPRPALEIQPGQGLPRLRALAQLARMYLLSEGPEGDLYLVDQHAAHERITYERLMAQYGSGAVEAQRLLIPQLVVTPPATQAILLGGVAELAEWGFELEEADQGVRVRSVPATVAADEIKPALLEVADHLSGAGGSTPERWREEVLVTLSCHTSIRTGHPLTLAEQQALLDQLARCRGPRTCPHGRPTVIVMTKQQLTRQFGRIQ